MFEPCPFCGSENVGDSQTNWVECENCGAMGAYILVPDSIKAWNTRPGEDKARAEATQECINRVRRLFDDDPMKKITEDDALAAIKGVRE